MVRDPLSQAIGDAIQECHNIQDIRGGVVKGTEEGLVQPCFEQPLPDNRSELEVLSEIL